MMTPQEAILEFQGYLDMPGDVDISREAVELAIEALERQMAKKPIKSKMVFYTCSKCYTILNQAGNYCDYCGQKIDWS